jgi:hypothetical protein
MHKKISSLISTVLVILITLTATFSALRIYPTKVYANPTIQDTVTVSPPSLTLNNLTETPTYWVNVTSTGTASGDYINGVNITLPTGWTLAAAATGYGFGFTTTAVVGSTYVYFVASTPAGFYNGAIANFSIPVKISTVPPTTVTWTVNCFQGSTPSASNPQPAQVTVALQFHATMTPQYVKNGTSYIYTLMVTNDACPTGIININITFPAGVWSFNVLLQSTPSTWTVMYDLVNTFMLSGPNLYIGQSASITVNMTTPALATTGEYYWNVTAWNAGSQSLGTYSMKAVVFSLPPGVSFIAPTVPYYSVASGNYMWINASVTGWLSLETYGVTVSCNDSRFELNPAQPSTETSPTLFVYYFINVTAIPDGPLNVQVTAIDLAGNAGTNTVSTIVDNTMPQLVWIDVVDQWGDELHYAAGTYWMTAGTTAVCVGVAFYNIEPLARWTGKVYFNNTGYNFNGNSTLYDPNSYYPNRYSGPAYPYLGYPVPAGANLLTVNITLVDGSSPTTNRYTQTWTVMRDTIPPSIPSFGVTKTICGGIIIPGLTATDNVGIDHYLFYLNGSSYWLYPDDVNSTTLDWDGPFAYWWPFAAVNNITLLQLYALYSAGAVANITIVAVDYGSNMGPPVTLLVTVPAGVWYPIEMYPKWNLISLPLIPNSTSITDIYSLMLLKGAAGVNFAYAFDNTAKTWTLMTTSGSMTDGNSYWINMKAYDVLIVQGYHISMPPGSPPSITQYTYKQGWNLAGFTEDTNDIWDSGYYAYDYVASLQSTMVLQSYFRFAYSWDPYDQQWFTVDLYGSVWPYRFYPGQGFYLYLYNDQILIPPIVPP